MKAFQRGAVSGFSLVEVMIGIVIFGILLSLGLPAFSRLIADMRLRNQAEYVLSGLQLAKGEALKRNATIRFQLVSTLDTNCAIAASSNLWLVSHGNPTSDCDLAESMQNADTTGNRPYGTPPVLLIKGSQEQQTTAQTTIAVAATNVTTADRIACFTGTGRLSRIWNDSAIPTAPEIAGGCSASMNPATTAAPSVTIDITDPTSGTCFTDAPTPSTGTVRCQRIMVSPAGEIRMCDPGLSAAKHPNDPRVCS
ncbi:MAG: GspH/FimT family pseudopilin [Sulfurisoma sp.]|nr:GspH/FimT family pseudopilin [Sulfurisoma sp.]